MAMAQLQKKTALFSVLRAYHDGFGCYLLELKIGILSTVGEGWHVF
jgi:hypothetical protein